MVKRFFPPVPSFPTTALKSVWQREMKIPSDDGTATLHAMFPTLVYQSQLVDHTQYAAAFKNARQQFAFQPEIPEGGKFSAGEYHGQILLHQHKALRPFFETLANQVARYLKTLGMKPEFFEMQCLKSWFVICEPDPEGNDAAMVAHNHSGSDISWVYYVDVPVDCPAIQFHAGRDLKTALFESSFHYDWKRDEKSAVSTFNWWNSDSWSVHPHAGDLLLFPGHQLHSVDANHTKQNRVSVAGDIALVLREEYTSLEFGRTAEKHRLTIRLNDS